MKRVLIIYPSMMIGGSTTSLLSILSNLDYSKISIDLLLMRNDGPLMKLIPKSVNVLSSTQCFPSQSSLNKGRFFSLLSWLSRFKGLYYEREKKSSIPRSQIIQKDTVRFCKKFENKYDVAISFLELFSLYYLSEKVDAKKKISWYHINFSATGMVAKFERKSLEKIDKIVLVSEKCKNSFDTELPEFSNKSIVIENILSQNVVKTRAKQTINYQLPDYCPDRLNIISVCRLDLKSKGLDRGIKALKRLKDEKCFNENFHWYIIGGGSDYDLINQMIKECNLESYIDLCGQMVNPLPLEVKCNVFFLPSRYEGKPMAVTEAQMLGVVPMVTNYPAASEQIIDGIDGVIIPNDDDSIYTALKRLLQGKIDIQGMHCHLQNKDFSNPQEIKTIEKLLLE